MQLWDPHLWTWLLAHHILPLRDTPLVRKCFLHLLMLLEWLHRGLWSIVMKRVVSIGPTNDAIVNCPGPLQWALRIQRLLCDLRVSRGFHVILWIFGICIYEFCWVLWDVTGWLVRDLGFPLVGKRRRLLFDRYVVERLAPRDRIFVDLEYWQSYICITSHLVVGQQVDCGLSMMLLVQPLRCKIWVEGQKSGDTVVLWHFIRAHHTNSLLVQSWLGLHPIFD